MTIYFYFIYFGIFPVANDDQGDDGAAPVPKTLPLACQRSLAPDRHSEDDHGPIFFLLHMDTRQRIYKWNFSLI